MVKRVLALTVLGLALSATPGLAHPADHHPRGVNARQHRQAARIVDGVHDGELTRAEATRLRAESAAIRAEERIYRSTGGGVSPWEARDLRRDLNRESRDIRRATHNPRVRS